MSTTDDGHDVLTGRGQPVITPVPDEIRKAAHAAAQLPLSRAFRTSPAELIDLALDVAYPLIVASERERICEMAAELEATVPQARVDGVVLSTVPFADVIREVAADA